MSNDWDLIDLRTVRCGERFWQCEAGQNVELEAMADAFQQGDLVQCQARNVQTNEPVALRVRCSTPWYGPMLYARPQYISQAMRELLAEPRETMYRALSFELTTVQQLLKEVQAESATLREQLQTAEREWSAIVRCREDESRTLRAALAVLAEDAGGVIVIPLEHLQHADELEHAQYETTDEAGPDVVFRLKSQPQVQEPFMDAQEYQKLAARTLIDRADFAIHDDELLVIWNAIGLAGEAGEVCDLVKKGIFHQHGLDRDALIKELGDVLWYTAALCTKLGVGLDEVMERNIDKLHKRYPAGFSSEASRQRNEHDGRQ